LLPYLPGPIPTLYTYMGLTIAHWVDREDIPKIQVHYPFTPNNPSIIEPETLCRHLSGLNSQKAPHTVNETEFLNFYGAQESILRNQLHQAV
jgi:hypothetical protein